MSIIVQTLTNTGIIPGCAGIFPTAQQVVNSVSQDLLQRIAPEDPILLDYINRVQLQLLRVSRWTFLQSPPQRFVTQLDRTDYWIGPMGSGPLDVVDTGLNISNLGPIKTDTFYDRTNFRQLSRISEPLLSGSFSFRDGSARKGAPRRWRNAPDTPCLINLYPAPDNQNNYQPSPEAPVCNALSAGTDAITTTATDSFIRANQNPIQGSWTIRGGPGPYALGQILNNQLTGQSGISSDMVFTGTAFNNDQFVQATLQNLVANSGYAVLLLRANTSNNLGYAIMLDSQFGALNQTTDLNIFNQVGKIGHTTVVPRVGDIFRAQIIGSQIQVFQNGVLVLSASDGLNTIGSPGIAASLTLGNPTPGNVAWTSFTAGNVIGGSGLPPRFYFVRTTFVDSLGNESSASDETRIFLPANSALVVQPPQEIPQAASGVLYNRFNVYAFNAGSNSSITSGNELLVTQSGPLSTSGAYQEPPTGLPANGTSFPTTNNLEVMGGYLIEFRYYQAKPQVNSLMTTLLIPSDYFDVLVAGVNYFTAQFLREESAQQYWQQEYQSGITGMIRDKNLFPRGPEFMSPDPATQGQGNYFGYETELSGFFGGGQP